LSNVNTSHETHRPGRCCQNRHKDVRPRSLPTANEPDKSPLLGVLTGSSDTRLRRCKLVHAGSLASAASAHPALRSESMAFHCLCCSFVNNSSIAKLPEASRKRTLNRTGCRVSGMLYVQTAKPRHVKSKLG